MAVGLLQDAGDSHDVAPLGVERVLGKELGDLGPAENGGVARLWRQFVDLDVAHEVGQRIRFGGHNLNALVVADVLQRSFLVDKAGLETHHHACAQK